jgi:3',5'-cyclic-AMP phosphodiesterase
MVMRHQNNWIKRDEREGRMLIVQFSDPHITVAGKKSYGIAPTAETLGLCIDHVNQMVPKPDLVLVSGDITTDGLLASTRHAKELLSRLDCPYYVIPGNHDDRSILWSVFGEDNCPVTRQGFINFTIDGFGLRIIAMDSTRPGYPGGEICSARLAWLKMRLAKETGKPTIIFMHHPPVKFGVLETDSDGFEGADELGTLIGKFPNIHAVICGHVHLPAQTRWRGTIVSTAPSTGMQLGLDLSRTRPSEFYLNAPGYQLHHFTEGRNLITHTIYVNRINDGPYRFQDHQPNRDTIGRKQ